ncbi:MAG: sugar ABC transporter ATP-binding protein [Firmicutes bacterium]|nr:sugar ABC transporter ATP-binding protein [Bacillota bacterium]
MSEQFLLVRDICKSFSGVEALKGVSLTINRGEVQCLIGENGSGKSTLIKVIAGVVTPDHGEVIINGKSYRQLRPIDSIREGIQVIYQDFSLFPNLTVAENIALSHELELNKHFVNWKEVYRISENAIQRIDVELDPVARVENLSVADKQLIAIARALTQNAKLIIMDEPTSTLTRREVESLFRVIKNLKTTGVSVLFVSHKLNEVLEIADRICVLRNGTKVADGAAQDFDRIKLIYFMTGRQIREVAYEYKKDREREGSVLRVQGLTSKGRFADVSFELWPGEIVGITGLLGSGRTEVAMALFGLQPADAGDIYVNGRLQRIKNVQDAINSGIAYVPEDRLTQGLFLEQPIGRNIIVCILHKLMTRLKLIDERRVDIEIHKWIEKLRISTRSTYLPVKTLSGGNQQRVLLAKWLATTPQILILNSPTVGVDVGSKEAIYNIIKQLADQGISILIISDDIPEILQNCNRVLLMRKGRIIEEFPASSVNENELAQKLLDA